jgi:hypothetical protein
MDLGSPVFLNTRIDFPTEEEGEVLRARFFKQNPRVKEYAELRLPCGNFPHKFEWRFSDVEYFREQKAKRQALNLAKEQFKKELGEAGVKSSSWNPRGFGSREQVPPAVYDREYKLGDCTTHSEEFHQWVDWMHNSLRCACEELWPTDGAGDVPPTQDEALDGECLSNTAWSPESYNLRILKKTMLHCPFCVNFLDTAEEFRKMFLRSSECVSGSTGLRRRAARHYGHASNFLPTVPRSG